MRILIKALVKLHQLLKKMQPAVKKPLLIQEQTAALQQVTESAQNVSNLAQKTVDILMGEFKISTEEKSGQRSSGKFQNSGRKGSLKAR